MKIRYGFEGRTRCGLRFEEHVSDGMLIFLGAGHPVVLKSWSGTPAIHNSSNNNDCLNAIFADNHRVEIRLKKEKHRILAYTNRIPIQINAVYQYLIQSINIYQEKQGGPYNPVYQPYTKQIRNNVSALSFLNLL
jgi:hypothetical protein